MKRLPNKVSKPDLLTPGQVVDGVRYDELQRIAIAGSSETPGEVLVLLSEDHSDLVKLAVARNNRTPHHIVAKLANHGSMTVKAGLAEDCNTPLEILNELSEDPNEAIRIAARNSRRQLVAALRLDERSTGDGRGFSRMSTQKWA